MYCPLDNKIIYKPAALGDNRRRRQRKKGQSHEDVSARSLDMSIKGHGLISGNQEGAGNATGIASIKSTGIIKKGTVRSSVPVRTGNAHTMGVELSLLATPISTGSSSSSMSSFHGQLNKHKSPVKGLSSSLPHLVLSHDNHMTRNNTGSLPKLMQSHESHVTGHEVNSLSISAISAGNQLCDQLVLPSINAHSRNSVNTKKRH